MRILTLSESPYVLNKLGKLHSDLLIRWSKNHEIASACWGLDVSYFMPDELDGKHYYETEKKICQIYPFDFKPVEALRKFYDIIKKFKPDVVVTLGDYYETDFVYSIKAVYPSMFKWVAIFTSGSNPIEKSHAIAFDYIDQAIVTTSDGLKCISGMSSVPIVYSNPGINNEIFYPNASAATEFSLIASLRNSQESNIPAFLRALSKVKDQSIKIKAYLHTNINDVGSYDLKGMIADLGLEENVSLPDVFCSNQEGPNDEYIRSRYAGSTVYINTSGKSSTAVGLLESMACGCIPIVSGVGAMKDVLADYDWVGESLIPSNIFIGDRHHEMAVVSDDGLAGLIKWQYHEHQSSNCLEKREKCIEIAKRYSRERFVIDVDKAIGRSVGDRRPVMAVDEV